MVIDIENFTRIYHHLLLGDQFRNQTFSPVPNHSYHNIDVVNRNNNKTYHVMSKLTSTEVLSVILLSIVCLVGTIGNALVIWVFGWKRRKARKRFELLLFILSITDFVASIIVPALFLYGTVTKFQQWHFGYYGCKFIMSVFPVTVTFSQGILILISYERYKSIKDPFGGPLRRTFIFCWLLLTLLVALVLVSPYVYAVDLISMDSYGVDTCIPSHTKFEEIFLYSTGNFCRDFTATLSMIILGTMTNKHLKTGGLLGGIKVYEKRQKNAMKARSMLIVVVCVFSFCVLPLDLYQVIVYSMYKLNFKIDKPSYAIVTKVNTFFTILQIANSATNILIYSRMHRGFSRHLILCAEKGKEIASNSLKSRSTYRTTLRRKRSTSTDSLPSPTALLAILPITPNTIESDCLKETQYENYNERCSVL